ncbi:MAG: response regulator [Gammaproteobacteria bacterium]|nr:response regulator [Gammaproteobacteria bacterium]
MLGRRPHFQSLRFSGWLLVAVPALPGVLLAAAYAVFDAVRSDTAVTAAGLRALAPALARDAARRLDSAADLQALMHETLRRHGDLGDIQVRRPEGETLHAAARVAGLDGALARLIALLAPEPEPIVVPLGDPGPVLQLTPLPPERNPRLHARVAGLLLAMAAAFVFTLVPTGFAIVRLARRQAQLARVALDLASGRLDARAPRQTGVTDALAQGINRLGQQLAETRGLLREQAERDLPMLRNDLLRSNTRLRATEEALAQAQSTAMNRGEMLAHMTHELRTPLAAIVGHADLLAAGPLAPEAAEHVETLRKSARGLLAMINDLLDWSRIEAGKLTLNSGEFALGDCVEEIIELLAPLAYEKDLELVHILYHDVPSHLVGDAGRLKQVMTNLLSNAIKFTQRGEVVLRVMKEREDAHRVTLNISVADTGIGIPPEMHKRLFEPYQQAAGQSRGGTGLGLAITRRLVERMGGSMSVQSVPGQGSTFSAVLTLALPEVLTPPVRLEGLRGLHVWLHEPHRTAQLALLHCLEYWGMSVRVLDTASELLASMRPAPEDRGPDLIILGLRMRDAEDAAVREILAAGRQHPAPLLGLVNSVSRSQQQALLDAGASACLPKSLPRRALYDALGELARRKEAATRVVKPLMQRTVLVADNNLANRRFIATLLATMGAEVIEAHDGLSAVAAWHVRRPDFLLLDIHMPGLDGLAVAREIRTREGASRHAVILGISAHLEDEERRQLALSGMDGELLKPFDQRQLLRALGPWLQLSASPPPSAVDPTERLVTDPQLLALLTEELPAQLRELEEAYARADADAARSAAHQVHGTASFYRLRPLKLAAHRLEQHLAEPIPVAQHPRLRDDMAAVRGAVMEVLRELRQPAGGTATAG